MHLLLWGKKLQSAQASQTESGYFHLLSSLLPSLTKRSILIPKVTVIQFVLVQWGETYMPSKPSKDYSAVAHETISVPKPVSLLYQDQVLWYQGKYH